MPKKSSSKKDTKQNSKPEKVDVEDGEDKFLASPSSFDLKRLAIRPIDDSNKDSSQMNAYPKYVFDGKLPKKGKILREGDNFVVATGPIKIVKGGIPKLDAKWRPTDQQRQYFWLPYDEEQESSVELFKMIDEIDDYLHEEIDKDKKDNENGLLVREVNGKEKKITGRTYLRTAKMSPTRDDDDDDGNDKKTSYKPYRRLKVKFSTKYDESLGKDDPKEINTMLFLGDNDEPMPSQTVTDIEKHFFWNCTAQFALMFSKIWIAKGGKKECGLSVKCIQIAVVDKPERKQNIHQQFAKSVFASHGAKKLTSKDKEEDDEENKDKKGGDESEPDSESDSDSSDSDDSDNEEEKVEKVEEDTKSKGSVKSKNSKDKKEDSDTDDSDDSDDSDSDSDDSDSDDSDDDSDEEDKKKSSKKDKGKVKVAGKKSSDKKKGKKSKN